MLNTFIIWQSGFKNLSELLWDISANFDVKMAEKIVWKNWEISQNLTKIYPNRSFDEKSLKIKEIGGNELIVIIAEDKNVNLKEGININAINYKNKYRDRGRNFLHISDNEEEAMYNYLGLKEDFSKDQFLAYHKSPTLKFIKGTDNNIILIKNIKFNHILDVFDILNKYENYIILRNWEGLPQSLTLDEHDDIDILTQDYYRTLTLLNAQPILNDPRRVCHLIRVNNQLIPFDIRYINDGYYDTKWQKEILKNKKMYNGFYIASDVDYFWSLLYHAIFHKNEIKEDYRIRLKKYGSVINGFSNQILDDIQQSKKFLREFLKKYKYTIPKPVDPSINVSKNFWYHVLNYFKWRFNMLKAIINRQRTVDLSKIKGLKRFSDNLKRAKIIKRNVYKIENIIIKSCPNEQKFLLRNEKKILDKIKNDDISPKPLDYIIDNDKEYLILNYIKGKDLARKISLNKKKQKNLKTELDKISNILKKYNIIHRDIRPHNLIFNEDKLYLVDYQFAIINGEEIVTNNPKEKYILSTVKKNLGGQWYKNELPLNKKDENAIEKIKNQYCKYVSLIEKIKFFPHHLQGVINRYINYK